MPLSGVASFISLDTSNLYCLMALMERKYCLFCNLYTSDFILKENKVLFSAILLGRKKVML